MLRLFSEKRGLSPIIVVPNLAGFNGNLLQIIKSIIAIPNLSKGPLISPHTLPPGYVVAPPRYTTPYTESKP